MKIYQDKLTYDANYLYWRTIIIGINEKEKVDPFKRKISNNIIFLWNGTIELNSKDYYIESFYNASYKCRPHQKNWITR